MICFFGASVTQQKNSYAEFFLNKIKTVENSEQINYTKQIFGYGGMHLNNAALCHIDTVINANPTVCFIDFFSTAYITCCHKTYEYIDTIVYKFSLINCKLIFLFLPRQEHAERIPFYTFCKKYLNKHKLTYFDLCQDIKYCPTLLRDTVHTTPLGSQVYSDYIYDKYMSCINSIIIPANIKKTKYCQIHKININSEFTKHINLSGKCTLFGIEAIIGPYSGILNISCSNNPANISINTWDQWCHYPRDTIILLQESHVLDICSITISQQIFDTTLCKNAEIDFSLIEKKIVIKSIFYIDGLLNFVDGI